MPGLLIVLICFSCALLTYLWWQKKERFREPPLLPGAWPFVGHVVSAIGRKNVRKFIQRMAVDLSHVKGVGTILIGPMKFYVMCDPVDSLIVANRCLDKSVYYKFTKSWIGDSLLTSESAVWKKDRKMLMPAFNHHLLDGFLETFNKGASKIVEKITAKVDRGSFDHSDYVKEYSIETLCKTVLGVDISNTQEYIHVTESIMDIMVKRFVNLFLHIETVYNWTNLKKTEDKYTKFVSDFADKLIEKKRTEMKGKNQNCKGTKPNFLDILLDISTVEDMTDVKIRNHLNLMIVAGFDTVSVALLFILVVIGSHEKVQEKIYEEIDQVLGDTSRDVEKSHLDRLVYLEAAIKECIRIYPPAPVIVREINENIELENYTLYAGHSCFLLLDAMNMHSIWGDDAQAFKPERWLDPATLPNNPAVFATFGIGRRNCIGKYFAMMSMKTFLVHLIRKFIITADWTKMEVEEDAHLRVESGHHITLQRRP